MSAQGMLGVIGTAVGGLIGWTEAPPAADPAGLRALLGDLGLPVPSPDLGLPVPSSDEAVVAAVRAFQARVGLEADGVAGPRTVHLLARYAAEARELRRLDLAA